MFYLEHIFINIIIKLPQERYRKYKKKMIKEGKKTNTPNRKGTSESSFHTKTNIRSTWEQNTHSTEREGVKWKTHTAAFTAALLFMFLFSLTMALTSGVQNHKTVHDEQKKKKKLCIKTYHQAVWKPTVISLKFKKQKLKKQNIWIIIIILLLLFFFIIQKVLSATSKENQWSIRLELNVPTAARCHDTITQILHFKYFKYSYRRYLVTYLFIGNFWSTATQINSFKINFYSQS